MKIIERESKYMKNKKNKEKSKEYDSSDEEGGGNSNKIKKQAFQKDENAIDMRREDAKLERILREYNNEPWQGRKKEEKILNRPLDLPFYKGIQMPDHLKWVTMHSVRTIN
jgi:hypothetical protein